MEKIATTHTQRAPANAKRQAVARRATLVRTSAGSIPSTQSKVKAEPVAPVRKKSGVVKKKSVATPPKKMAGQKKNAVPKKPSAATDLKKTPAATPSKAITREKNIAAIQIKPKSRLKSVQAAANAPASSVAIATPAQKDADTHPKKSPAKSTARKKTVAGQQIALSQKPPQKQTLPTSVKARPQAKQPQRRIRTALNPMPAPMARAARLRRNSAAPLANGPRYTFASDIPEHYTGTYIKALPRDPQSIYTFWEVGEAHQSVRSEPMQTIRHAAGASSRVLRLFEVSDSIPNSGSLQPVADISLDEQTDSRYVHVPQSGRQYCLELGYLTGENEFYSLARSNTVALPQTTASPVIAEVWAAPGTDGILHVAAPTQGHAYSGPADERLPELQPGGPMDSFSLDKSKSVAASHQPYRIVEETLHTMRTQTHFSSSTALIRLRA
jgi:hypothetical protein